MNARFVQVPFEMWSPQVTDLLSSVGDIAYIAGGAARQLVMRDDAPPAWDIDLFLFDGTDTDRCKDALRRMGYTQNVYTEHSSQFDPPNPENQLHVQVIERYEDEWSLTSGQPEDVLSHFSFTTEMFAIVMQGGMAVALVGEHSVEDTLSRMLRIQNVTDPLVVTLRAVKYGYKGYGISLEEMRKVLDEYLARTRVTA